MELWFGNLLLCVNSKTKGCEQYSFAFGALEFGSCSFELACTHMTPRHDPATGPCPTRWASRCVIWLVCGLDHPLGVDWGWGSLALIPNKFWTKAKSNFVWFTLLLQDDRMIQLFHIIRSKKWKNVSGPLCWHSHVLTACSLQQWQDFELSHFHYTSCLLLEYIHIHQHTWVLHDFPNQCCHVTSHSSMYTTISPRHLITILCDSPTTADTFCVQVIEYVWQWEEETIHMKFMT